MCMFLGVHVVSGYMMFREAFFLAQVSTDTRFFRVQVVREGPNWGSKYYKSGAGPPRVPGIFWVP